MSSSTSVDGLEPQPNQIEAATSKPSTKASRQRFKPQLSCTFCRHRKLKCDRNLPCENCIKKNQGPSCTYVHATKISQIQKSSTGSGSKDVQNQIKHLEDLVISLMNQTNGNSKPGVGQTTPESSPDNHHYDEGLGGSTTAVEQISGRNGSLMGTAESLGRMEIEDKKMNYVGGDHWVAILDSIACLKDRLGNNEPQLPAADPIPSLPGPELLVGSVKPATRSEILASLPARDIVDALVARYFATPDVGSSMLHKPTFMREYHIFWSDPKRMPIVWIGLLYSIICLSAHFESLGIPVAVPSNTGTLLDTKEMIDVFRIKTVQCLVLSNYTEPGPYTVETMLLYYVADHFRSADAQFGGWLVFGLLVRAAMRVGLHRDASHYPNISVFKGEMQRRLWAAILHMDLQTSLQVGLPRMLKEGIYDTKQPRNLLDEDFDENSTQLPPGREEVESTAIGYSNSKHRVTSVFGMIVDQANSVFPTTYEEVMRLDQRLHDVYEEVPEVLKVRDIRDLEVGKAITRVRKFAIDLTFQKARCILHRKFFVTRSSTHAYQYPYSMKTCVEAAMRILQSQIYMHSETGLGRQLYGHRWKTSSLMLHDFLLAAMLVCLYLGHTISRGEGERTHPETDIKVKWSKEEMKTTIQGSLDIWEETSSVSKDAKKAASVLKAMLSKIGATDTPMAEPETISDVPQGNYSNKNASAFPSTALGPTSQISMPMPLDGTVDAALFAPMTSESLDWQMWDEQFYTNRPVDPHTYPIPDIWNVDGSVAGSGVTFQDPGQFFWGGTGNDIIDSST